MLRSCLTLGAFIHLATAVLARDSLAQADSLKQRSEAAPIELLSQWREDVQWKRDSLLLSDVTLDRETDAVVLGLKPDSIIVGIVAGPFGKSSKHWILEFKANSQGGLCGRASDVRLQLEKLSIPEDAPTTCDSSEVARECRRWRETAQLLYLGAARGSKGINLGDEKCDSFHIYFDPVQGQPVWWRR